MIIKGVRLANIRFVAGVVPVTLSWVTDQDLGEWNYEPISVMASASNAASVVYTLLSIVSGYLPGDVVFDAQTGSFVGTDLENGDWTEPLVTVVRIQASVGTGIPITRDFTIVFPLTLPPR